jgi:hypothetical protein
MEFDPFKLLGSILRIRGFEDLEGHPNCQEQPAFYKRSTLPGMRPPTTAKQQTLEVWRIQRTIAPFV